MVFSVSHPVSCALPLQIRGGRGETLHRRQNDGPWSRQWVEKTKEGISVYIYSAYTFVYEHIFISVGEYTILLHSSIILLGDSKNPLHLVWRRDLYQGVWTNLPVALPGSIFMFRLLESKFQAKASLFTCIGVLKHSQITRILFMNDFAREIPCTRLFYV